MSLTIDGDTYSEDLYWRNRATQPKRAGSSRQTMGVGGRTVRQSLVTNIKRQVEIEAIREGEVMTGYWTHAQIEALMALETSGAPVELTYEGETMTVWVAPGGIDVAMRVPRPNPAADDMYYGTVTFEEL